ncbi:MAG: DUF1844 domain-containing protein [Deltaproteobacteria bacterium]|nr:DUF1844 domain-containing protein [Deltaproteobacteria bacterium]
MSASDSATGHRPLDFQTFVLSLGTSALVQLGEAPVPGQTSFEKDVEGARQTIDILAMLETKTAGNLTEQESSLLRNLLTDLRLRFVRAGK